MTREDGTWVNYTYDDGNHVTQITITNTPTGYFGTTQQDFEYNGLGQQTEAKDNNTGVAATEVTVTKYYDSLGRQVEETLRIGQSGTLRATSSDLERLGFCRISLRKKRAAAKACRRKRGGFRDRRGGDTQQSCTVWVMEGMVAIRRAPRKVSDVWNRYCHQ